VAAGDSPVWRRAFDGVERRVGRPLESATSSSDFQSVALKLGRAKRAISRPVQSVAGLGLRIAGLPSHAEIRDLRRQLGDVQREVSALRREVVQAEREQEHE
jgi:hypothetical protein